MDGRILWIDGSAGAAGDMILGAMIDLGVPAAHVRRTLGPLDLPGWRLTVSRVEREGISARKVRVGVREDGPGRRLADVRRILGRGKLPAAVRDLSIAIFERLFAAEAEAHGTRIDRVHLHEAGAVDAIVDIVGTCVGLAWLAPRRVVVSRLTTGWGTVPCSHGRYPVPGPATTFLLRGVPVEGGAVEAERVTPTGAAILTTIADDWGPLPPMRLDAVGHGAGDRRFEGHPNVLRILSGRPLAAEDGSTGSGPVSVATFSVDDATPQVLAWAAERLLEAGALDVSVAPVTMKKGRPGHEVTVVARRESLGAVVETVLRETTTLGVRHHEEDRTELARAIDRVKTPYGAIGVKVGRLDGEIVQAWPEFDECAAAARRHGVALKTVQRAALEAHRTSATTRPPRARRGSR